MKMTNQQRHAHRDAITAEYGQGPDFETKDSLDKVYFTNISGIKWFFTKASEYKDLKKQIANNRKRKATKRPNYGLN